MEFPEPPINLSIIFVNKRLPMPHLFVNLAMLLYHILEIDKTVGKREKET
jgi:hypothetical protein